MAEAWYTFPAQMGDHRAFLSFDHGYAEIADSDQRQVLLRIRVQFKQPNQAGLPTSKEFPQLLLVDEALDKAVTASGGVYVGRITVNGARHFFFYVDFDEKAASDIVASVERECGYPLDMAYENDPSRDGYWQQLYPTEDDWQVIRDMRVLDVLNQNGDDQDIERSISHWAYFEEDHAADAFKAWLAEQGYRLETAEKQDDGKIEVTFTHTGSTRLETITSRTIALNRKAKTLQGDYDGWETSIEPAR